MAGTVCGPQFKDKNCDCYLQVTAGTTPATGQASNPLRLCSFVSNDGTLLACDPGCCKTDCALPDEEDETSASTSTSTSPTSVWWIIVVTVLFGLLIMSSYFFRVASRNPTKIKLYLAFVGVLILTIIIVAAVGATQKKKGGGGEETATTTLTPDEVSTWDDTKVCKGHSIFRGTQTYTPAQFKSEVNNSHTVGFSKYSYDEYCRYGKTQLVGGHDKGWATLDSCCKLP